MKDRYIAVVLILLLLLLSVVGIALLSKKTADSRRAAAEEQKKQELYDRFLEKDVTLYWIGDLPKELEAISSKIIVAEEITTDTMPMKSPDFHMVEYDKDGNKVFEKIPVEYTDHLYIVISHTVLTAERYDIIRECIKDNGVRVIVLGSDAIYPFREHLILPYMSYEEEDSLAYSLKDGSASHVISQDSEDKNRALVEYLLGDMDNADRYV